MYSDKPAYETSVAPLPPVTAFTSANAALDNARSLAFRVSDMVDRLCGSQPSEVSGGAGIGKSGSVLTSLRDDADRTSEAVNRAMMQLNRLDRELPS